VTGLSGNGPQLGLRINEPLTLNGRGVQAGYLTPSGAPAMTGALHSKSGINRLTSDVNLTSSAGIGVDPDPVQSNSNIYFTNDYSLSMGDPSAASGPNIGGPSFVDFHKEGTGHLILPFSNNYTGRTFIHEGWITVQNNNSLGSGLSGSDTIQPRTEVESGAALHLKPKTPDASFNLLENLVLSGNGITHAFGLISQKGALMSLGGNNVVGGIVTQQQPTTDTQLNGNAGIGVEPSARTRSAG